MFNAWKTPEEQNRHCTGFLMRTEIEVHHALHGKIQSGELLTRQTRKCLSQGNGKEAVENILSDMLVTEWTRVLSCSGLAQREVARFRFSFHEKTAVCGSVFLTIFSIIYRFKLSKTRISFYN